MRSQRQQSTTFTEIPIGYADDLTRVAVMSRQANVRPAITTDPGYFKRLGSNVVSQAKIQDGELRKLYDHYYNWSGAEIARERVWPLSIDGPDPQLGQIHANIAHMIHDRLADKNLKLVLPERQRSIALNLSQYALAVIGQSSPARLYAEPLHELPANQAAYWEDLQAHLG